MVLIKSYGNSTLPITDYEDLTVIQRIAFKGMIKYKHLRPAFFKESDHKYFDGLNMLWIVSNFKDAINQFLKL